MGLTCINVEINYIKKKNRYNVHVSQIERAYYGFLVVLPSLKTMYSQLATYTFTESVVLIFLSLIILILVGPFCKARSVIECILIKNFFPSHVTMHTVGTLQGVCINREPVLTR